MKSKNRIVLALALIALDAPPPTESGRSQKLASRDVVPVWLRLRTAWTTRLVSMLLLLTLPAAVQAQFNYTTNNGTITITGYTGLGGAVAIPSTITELPVTSIGVYAFQYNTNLTSVTIPNSVTSIGDWAFDRCWRLTSVMIPGSVTSIGNFAFYECGLTSVMIPSSVTSIGGSAFYQCPALTNVTIGNGVTSIGNFAFAHGPRLTSVTIPDSVTSIGDYAFDGCSGLTSLTIPNSVTYIGQYAFAFCTSLSSVTIGNGVTSIGSAVFVECSSLTNITIPNSVTSIGDLAFASCTNLTSVTIPNSVINIAVSAFGGCTSLTEITVDALNSVYSSVDGVLFNKSQTVLIQCPAGKAGSYTIPNSVTYIGGGAFYGSTRLTSVRIPNSVTYIGQNAFASCTSLSSVTIGTGVIGILYGAFSDCTSLTSITIPNSVTAIAAYAFYSCTSLTGVNFQGNAPSFVDSSAFYGADGVTVYYLPGTTGWGPTFGGRPTALWSLPNPLILASGTGFGVQTNGFGFIISWAANNDVVVEASTDLANPSWSPLQTNTLTGGSSYFRDHDWTNYPGRFYRLRAL